MKWQEFYLVPQIVCSECLSLMYSDVKRPLIVLTHPAKSESMGACSRVDRKYNMAISSLPAMMLEEVE